MIALFHSVRRVVYSSDFDYVKKHDFIFGHFDINYKSVLYSDIWHTEHESIDNTFRTDCFDSNKSLFCIRTDNKTKLNFVNSGYINVNVDDHEIFKSGIYFYLIDLKTNNVTYDKINKNNFAVSPDEFLKFANISTVDSLISNVISKKDDFMNYMLDYFLLLDDPFFYFTPYGYYTFYKKDSFGYLATKEALEYYYKKLSILYEKEYRPLLLSAFDSIDITSLEIYSGFLKGFYFSFYDIPFMTESNFFDCLNDDFRYGYDDRLFCSFLDLLDNTLSVSVGYSYDQELTLDSYLKSIQFCHFTKDVF